VADVASWLVLLGAANAWVDAAIDTAIANIRVLPVNMVFSSLLGGY
jgi:hypothetical protein